jgi:CheY-like chemotaxis protein
LRLLGSEAALQFALVDVDLPGMSGLEFAKRLNRSRPDVYTVLITAAEGERIQSFLREHPVTYLRKPLDFEHLLGVLSGAHTH